MERIIYHGSEKRIETPKFGYGKRYNDYGLGFYCTEDFRMAAEWAVNYQRDGFVNKYSLEDTDLMVLNLNTPEYTILHWLTILIENRTFDVQSDFGAEAIDYLKTNFSVSYNDYDVIIGYRADDSYFSFAQDFLNNTISMSTLSEAMRLGKLGEQIVLKSRKAFESLRFSSAEIVKAEEWYPRKEARDHLARHEYKSIRGRGYHRGDLYMMQILDMELGVDDVRIRSDFT